MTRRIAARFLASLLTAFVTSALVLATPPAAAADKLSADEEKAISATVRGQLDAFAADDAPRAFSYASAAIRAMFGTAEKFMAMVKTGYAVVYRPASVVFFRAEPLDDEVVLRVQMTDRAGAVFIATYRLERQSDRSWRIAGCDVAPSRGSIT